MANDEIKLMDIILLMCCLLCVSSFTVPTFHEEPVECVFMHGLSNFTVGDVYLADGDCCVQEAVFEQTNEVCKGGFLGVGMSCYEASEPHTETYLRTICRSKGGRE